MDFNMIGDFRALAAMFKLEADSIPGGADPVWQPDSYLQGCAGWCATTGYRLGPNKETPWLVPLHKDPTADFKSWLLEHGCEELAALLEDRS